MPELENKADVAMVTMEHLSGATKWAGNVFTTFSPAGERERACSQGEMECKSGPFRKCVYFVQLGTLQFSLC